MQNVPVQNTSDSSHNFSFWFHLFITILAWIGPFLFSWYLMVAAYLIVILQFMVFDKCLLNAKHDLKTEGDATFYSYLFEQMGMEMDRPRLKKFVRIYLYPILGAFTVLWQLYFGFEAILF
ncbi:hypothetical protein [Owenweeksia hongkongensis]|uniref:hypothetical protein n=1 Tax=Owenweeksia hongkongensis TaxID=253245 RepID=UPI003A90C3CA